MPIRETKKSAPPRGWLIVSLLLFAVAIGLVANFYLTKPKPATPDELVQEALGAETPEEQEKAAAALSQVGPAATEQMVQLMTQAKTPEIRAHAIYGLGAIKHWKSMPDFFERLDDPSPLVRGRAAMAIQRIIGFEYNFRAEDPPEKRQAIIEQMRREYERMLKLPPPEYR